MFVPVSVARPADVLAPDALTKLVFADDLYSGHEALFADDLYSDHEALKGFTLLDPAVDVLRA